MLDPIETHLLDLFKFILGALFLFYIPGTVALRAMKLNLRRSDLFFHSWIAGFFFSSCLYYASGYFNSFYLFMPILAGVAVVYVWKHIRDDISSFVDLYKNHRRYFYFFAGILVVLAGYAVLARFWAFYDKTGALRLYQDFYSDSLLGAATAAELKNRIPPENPLFAGVRFLYQYFPYTGVTLLHKYFGIKLLPVFFLYMRLASILIFSFSLFSLARRLFLSRWPQFLAFMLPFVLGMHIKIGYEIGFAFFLSGAFFYFEFLQLKKTRLMMLAALLWAACVISLTIFAISLCVGMAIYTLILWSCRSTLKFQQVRFLFVLGLCSILFVGVFWGAPSLSGQGSGEAAFGFHSEVSHLTKEKIRSISPDFFESWIQQKEALPENALEYLSHPFEVARLVYVGGVKVIAFFMLLLEVLQFAFIGFIGALVYLFRRRKEVDTPVFFLALVGVLSILIPFVFGPRESSGAIIFYQFGSFPLLLITGAFFEDWRFFYRKKIIGLVILGVFAWQFHDYVVKPIYRTWSHLHHTETSQPKLAMYEYIRKNVPLDETVIHYEIDETIYFDNRPDKTWIYDHHNYYFPIFTERGSLLIHPTLSSTFGKVRLPGDYDERLEDLNRFFSTREQTEALSILRKYQSNWFMTTTAKNVKFPLEPVFKLVFEQEGYKLYRKN